MGTPNPILGIFSHPTKEPRFRYAFPIWIPLVSLWLAAALCVVGMVLAVPAIRPYYAERKHGYTTWPERSPAPGPDSR